MIRSSLTFLLCFLAGCAATRTVDQPLPSDHPGEAAEYYMQKRAGSADPQRSYAIARERMRRMQRYSTADDAFAGGTGGAIANALETRLIERWTWLGPGNIGGRTRTLVIDPVEPQVMYAGGVSGGLWKTTDGGGQWQAIGDELANIAVNALVMDPRDRNVLYAGTGEGYFREEQRGTALPLRGNGIFVTRDGGASWTQLASTTSSDFHWVNDLVISRHDSSRVYAATRSGVWRSDDGGTQWTNVLPVTVKGGCLDLELRAGAEGDYLFASCGTFEQATVYRNRNAEGAQSWEPVLTKVNMGRTTLAIAPSNPSIIYALAASNEPGFFQQGLFALFRSTQNGDAGSWETRTTNTSADATARFLLTNALSTPLCVPPSGGVVNMGWYANAIAVDPVNADRVWVGSVDAFRSDDGGATWGVASYWWGDAGPSFVHADQHRFVFHPSYNGTSNKTMFVLNDGGVYRTDDATAEPARGVGALCNQTSSVAFTPLNHNFGVTQFYHGAVYPDGRTFFGGAQDNGTLRGSIDGGPNAWNRIFFGDGGYVAVDPNDTQTLYAEAQVGFLVRSDSGGEQFDYVLNSVQDSFLFITPFTLDPNTSTRIWIGGTRLWRSNNRGTVWSAASDVVSGRVSAIAVTPGSSSRVLAGTSVGDIVRSDQALIAGATTHWSAARPRDGFVSWITVDPTLATRVYATYAGFGGGAHVWMSADSGATWSPLDGSGSSALPDIPVHSIAVDPTRPERLYLGTDLGVFVSTDRGETWAVENTGFAAVVTETVLIAQGARGPAVYAFTHGRGAWRTELTPVPPRRRAVKK